MPDQIKRAIEEMAADMAVNPRMQGFMEGAAYAMQVLKEQSKVQEAEE